MGNLDLHLIKGRPAVHTDEDKVVGHIMIPVPPEKMGPLRQRLLDHGVEVRNDIAVPHPTEEGVKRNSPVDEVKCYRCFTPFIA